MKFLIKENDSEMNAKKKKEGAPTTPERRVRESYGKAHGCTKKLKNDKNVGLLRPKGKLKKSELLTKRKPL